MNDQKQFGGIKEKSELSQEVQLKTDKDAIVRKEKGVRSYILNEKCGLYYFTSITLKLSFEQKGIIV